MDETPDDWPGVPQDLWDCLYFPPEGVPDRRRRRRKRGRPRASHKKAFEALAWTLRGGTLERLPARFGSRRTACRRLREWLPSGWLISLWARYITRLSEAEFVGWAARAPKKEPRMAWQKMMLIDIDSRRRAEERYSRSTDAGSASQRTPSVSSAEAWRSKGLPPGQNTGSG